MNLRRVICFFLLLPCLLLPWMQGTAEEKEPGFTVQIAAKTYYYSEDSDSKAIDFDFLCRYGINIKIHDQRIERVIMHAIQAAVTQETEQDKYDYSAVIKSNQSFDILTFVAVDANGAYVSSYQLLVEIDPEARVANERIL